jgi:Alanine dehydrogenase/PNT, N-terminal domain/Alanine dehydrogenase/PNT, C-terminal domain
MSLASYSGRFSLASRYNARLKEPLLAVHPLSARRGRFVHGAAFPSIEVRNGMLVSIPKEILPGERRVALVPDLVPKLLKSGFEVRIEYEAGVRAGFSDAAYQRQGAILEREVLATADVVLKVQPPKRDEILCLKKCSVLVCFLRPDETPQAIEELASRRITAFAMELMPRISRAQPMDALSAMSTVAGYKGVIIAADRLPKLFPLLMTAAGTVAAARVLVIGAGVAGLQAIGTARRLGAVVCATYNHRCANSPILKLETWQAVHREGDAVIKLPSRRPQSHCPWCRCGLRDSPSDGQRGLQSPGQSKSIRFLVQKDSWTVHPSKR